jgi:hypothetical protein
MPFVGEVAASRGEVPTRPVSDTGASTGEMARAKAADVSAAAEAASATEPAAQMSTAAEAVSAAEPAAYMGASAEPAGVSTAETAAMSTAATMSTATTSAARERISGQSGGESGSSQEDDHRLT